MKKQSLWIIALSLSTLLQGCLIVDEDPDCIGDSCYAVDGDMAFYWDFELEDGSLTSSCATSEVARLDLEVFDEYGDSEFAVYDVPCESEGAILTNFLPGTYEIQLVGTCRTGEVTHEAWYELWVDSGANDYGTLTLDFLQPCD